VKGTDYWHSHF